MTKTDIHKKAMLEALEKSLGVVTTACKAVGIARQTHYEWMKEDEAYRSAVNNIDDLVLDFAESKLHKQIDSGDTTATIFFLKTRGKRRGYIEKSSLDFTSNGEAVGIPLIRFVNPDKSEPL
jgi:hypothetical protein